MFFTACRVMDFFTFEAFFVQITKIFSTIVEWFSREAMLSHSFMGFHQACLRLMQPFPFVNANDTCFRVKMCLTNVPEIERRIN